MCYVLHHMETIHSSLKDKLLEFFERINSEDASQKLLLKVTASLNVSELRTSYLVANCIANELFYTRKYIK